MAHATSSAPALEPLAVSVAAATHLVEDHRLDRQSVIQAGVLDLRRKDFERQADYLKRWSSPHGR